MSYARFLLKKVCKDKMNLLPFLLMGIFIVFIYFGSYRGVFSAMQDPMFNGEEEIETLKKDIDQSERETDSSSQGNLINSEYQSMAEARLPLLQAKLEAFENKDWDTFYQSDSSLITFTITELETVPSYADQEVLDILRTNIKYNTYMAEHSLGFDDRFSNIQGISYMAKVMNDYFAFMLSVFLIFMLSKLYCSSYIENLDMQMLLPYTYHKKQSIRLLSGTIVGIGVFLFASVLSILCGTFANTFGSLISPVLSYTMEGADTYSPLISFLPQFIVLFVLSTVCIANFVSVIAALTRKNMTCLLVSLATVIGFLFVVQDLAPLQDYIHLFPTTYFNSLKVLSGQFVFTSQNANVTFTNGVIVLFVSSILLYGVNFILPKLKTGV